VKKLVVLYCFAMLVAAALLYGAAPEKDVSGYKHPNIARAQYLVDIAYTRVVDAQKANEYDMGGHAEKARALLEETNKELKLAAVEANEHRKTGEMEHEDIYKGMPVKDVSASKHPNIAKAQYLVDKAYMRVVDAQKANEFDMEGHAEKARKLLEEANVELKLAAEAANVRK
jgi:hypothetical protein